MDHKSCARIGADQDEVTFLAVRAARESRCVLVAIRSHGDNEQYSRQGFFKHDCFLGFDEVRSINLFLNVWNRTQDAITGWLWKLLSFLLWFCVQHFGQVHGF